MAPMTDMERRRLQLYATNIRLQNTRRQIECLEFVLGHLYRELKDGEERALATPVAKSRGRRGRGARRSGAGR
jgi:plasmid replication initiation protein